MDNLFAFRRRVPALLLGLLAAVVPPPARADVLTSRLVDPPPAAGGRAAAPGARVDYRARGEDEAPEARARAGQRAPLSPLAALALVLVIPASAAVDPLTGGGAPNLQNNDPNQNNGNLAITTSGSPDGPPVGHAPEPGGLVLGLLGLAGLAVLSRRLPLRPAPAA